MKIVYFNYMWDLWGVSLGSTIKAIELLKALEKHGHEIKSYWRRDDIERKGGGNGVYKPTFRDFLKKHLDRYLHEPNQLLKNIPSIKEESAILEKEKPDLVISRMDSYVYSPVSLSKKTNIPFIIEVDSPSSYEKIVFQDYYRSTRKLLYWL
ncbi:hypothetical protein GF337_06250, partial [candidate division KSB1 bacterium]|nr:hypothetical protein [candidate division KSB1 bacterium]